MPDIVCPALLVLVRNSAQGSAEFLDLRARLFQQFVGGGVGDAEIRAEPECRPVHGGHALAFEQSGHEILIGIDHLPVFRLFADQRRTGRIDIKRAFGHRAFQTGRLIEHGDDEIPPSLEHLAALADEILRTIQRLDCRPLRDGTGARGLLALHHIHGLDQDIRSRRITNTPAGHRIGFRNAIHGQCAVHEIGFDFGRGDEFEIAIGEMLIHVIGQNPDMGMAHQNIGNGFQLGIRIGRTGRIGRRIQNNPFGFGRDRLFEIGSLQFELVFQSGRNENRLASAHQHHFGIADPIRGRNNHLVPRIERCSKSIEQNLLAAGADNDLRGLIVEIVFPLELFHDRFAQRHNTGNRRIFGFATVDRFDSGLFDILRCVEIGFTD